MIINLRGTSGSGKSTLVRELMARYAARAPVFREKRKQPYGYELKRDAGRPLYVVGHYETPCGGGDTIPSLDEVYASVNDYASRGFDVIYEGLIIQSDIRRCAELKHYSLLVVILDVTLETCLASIQSRRDARGDTRALNPKNTISKIKTIPAQVRRLKDAGVEVRLLGREAALETCMQYLLLGDHAASQDVFQLS